MRIFLNVEIWLHAANKAHFACEVGILTLKCSFILLITEADLHFPTLNR